MRIECCSLIIILLISYSLEIMLNMKNNKIAYDTLTSTTSQILNRNIDNLDKISHYSLSSNNQFINSMHDSSIRRMEQYRSISYKDIREDSLENFKLANKLNGDNKLERVKNLA